MSYFKPISISLSPNVEKDDIKLALNLIIRPWLWVGGKETPLNTGVFKGVSGDAVKTLEDEFKEYLGVKHAVSFNSGRSAFYATLQALSKVEGLKGTRVLLQAFTCNASINPVLWAGLEPVYVDCNSNDFSMNTEDLKKKVAENPSAKILLIQHTFGMPANMDEINLIVQQNNLILIEDCAHSLGAEYNGKKTGVFGEASFFSFSRDKVISSVYGGMATTNNDKLGEALRQAQKEFGIPGSFWVFQQLLHPILLHYFILPLYNFFDLGKAMLVFSQVFHVLSKAVSWKEKRGLKPDYFPKALPNALAIMALNQFGKLPKFQAQRQAIARDYFAKLSETKFKLPEKFSNRTSAWLRFTVQHKDAHSIIYEAWHKENILLGDWYTTPIAPFDTKLKEMKYQKGSCPNAERLSEKTLNLPTHINISRKDTERIINFLKKYG